MIYKEIRTNKEVVVNAMFPTEKFKLVFKDFQTVYNAEFQGESFGMSIYKIVVTGVEASEGVEEVAEELEYLMYSGRNLNKEQLDTLVDSLNITSTTYTDISNEQITKGLTKVIEQEAIFGLTEADLILL